MRNPGIHMLHTCEVPVIAHNFIWASKRLTDLHSQCKMSGMIDLMGVFRKIKVLSALRWVLIYLWLECPKAEETAIEWC